jgi:hypothetical protein
LCNTPKNLPTLVLAPSLFPHLLNYLPFLAMTGAWESGSGRGQGVPKLSLCVTRPKTYLLWFWLLPSFPIRSITLPFSQWPSAMGTH